MHAATRRSVLGYDRPDPVRQHDRTPVNRNMNGANSVGTTGTHRAGCCFVACTALFGPLLLVAGIVLLVYPNTRSERIDLYNTAGGQYDGSSVKQWSLNGLGTINGKPTSTHEVAVIPSGDTSTITLFDSYFATVDICTDDLVPPVDFGDSVIVKFQLNSVIPFTRVVTPQISRFVILTCSLKRGCSSAQMIEECSQLRGPSAQYEGTGCFGVGVCGVCRFPLYLQSYCAVVTPIVPLPPEKERFAESNSFRSCKYPFEDADGEQQYTSIKPAAVSFRVLRKGDPSLVLQLLTHGTDDFGDPPDPLRHAGASCAVIGSVGVAVAVIAGLLLRRSVRKSQLTGFETDSSEDNEDVSVSYGEGRKRRDNHRVNGLSQLFSKCGSFFRLIARCFRRTVIVVFRLDAEGGKTTGYYSTVHDGGYRSFGDSNSPLTGLAPSLPENLLTPSEKQKELRIGTGGGDIVSSSRGRRISFVMGHKDGSSLNNNNHNNNRDFRTSRMSEVSMNTTPPREQFGSNGNLNNNRCGNEVGADTSRNYNQRTEVLPHANSADSAHIDYRNSSFHSATMYSFGGSTRLLTRCPSSVPNNQSCVPPKPIHGFEVPLRFSKSHFGSPQ